MTPAQISALVMAMDLLRVPISRPNRDDADEEECRACGKRWYVQGPKKTGPKHLSSCILLPPRL